MDIAFVYSVGRPVTFLNKTFEMQDNGGSEGSMIRYALEFAKLGHTVTIFTPKGKYDTLGGVKWRPLEDATKTYDVAIALRFPNDLFTFPARVKALYCCDPEIPNLSSCVGKGQIDVAIVISKFQQTQFQLYHPIKRDRYLLSNAGVVYDDYQRQAEKVPGRFIYCSTPARGLLDLSGIWPMIKERVPDATLHVTGSFALWGLPTDTPPAVGLLGDQDGVTYLGCVSRSRLIQEQLESQAMLLPGSPSSPEMCCMAAMECAAAGNALVVTDVAALKERVTPNKTGYVIKRGVGWRREFAEAAIDLIQSPVLSEFQEAARKGERKHNYPHLAKMWLRRLQEELGDA